MIIYILTYEYGDKSAFYVRSVTDKHEVATAWNNAGEETRVYNSEIGYMTTKENPLVPWPK